MRYRSKPSDVEAVRWTGDNVVEVLNAIPDKTTLRGTVLFLLAGVDGAQKWVPVPVGHWLVHKPDDLSDVWPVHDDHFQSKYEPADG
jgi:hypothetical protein